MYRKVDKPGQEYLSNPNLDNMTKIYAFVAIVLIDPYSYYPKDHK